MTVSQLQRGFALAMAFEAVKRTKGIEYYSERPEQLVEDLHTALRAMGMSQMSYDELAEIAPLLSGVGSFTLKA